MKKKTLPAASKHPDAFERSAHVSSTPKLPYMQRGRKVLHTGQRDTSIGSEIGNVLIPCMQDSVRLRVMKKRKRSRADNAVG